MSCSTEVHALVVTSLLEWSAVKCIDSLPFSALKHHYNCYTTFCIVNRCSHSWYYFNLISNSSQWGKKKIKQNNIVNLFSPAIVNHILRSVGAILEKSKTWSSCHSLYKILFLLDTGTILQLMQYDKTWIGMKIRINILSRHFNA